MIPHQVINRQTTKGRDSHPGHQHHYLWLSVTERDAGTKPKILRKEYQNESKSAVAMEQALDTAKLG